MKPTRRLFAILLVLAMLLTNSGMTALAEAVLNMPAALQIIDEEAFYGDTSIGKIILSENVTEIRARAFANSSLSEINLPDSLTFIDDSAFDGPDKVSVTASKGTYAYDWAVENGYISPNNLQIDKILRSSEQTVRLNRTVVWSVRTTGGNGDVLYSYSLTRNGEVVDSQFNVSRNYYMYKMDYVGTYELSVTCTDEQGATATKKSDAVIVQGNEFSIVDCTVNNYSFVVGDEITVSVETSVSENSVLYVYELLKDSTVLTRSESSDSMFTTTISEPGEYQVRVTAVNGETQVTDTTSVFEVISYDVASPLAPELTFDENEIVLSQDQTNPSTIPEEALTLKWSSVEHAVQYGVTLDIWANNRWENMLSDEIMQNIYVISANTLGLMGSNASYRIGLYSINIKDGERRYYYFTVNPFTPDTSILIDGETEIIWHQSSYRSSLRSFDIICDLPWSASTDADWLSLTEQDNNLDVVMHYNDTSKQRSGIITVSNGVEDATINITQDRNGYFIIESPALSRDEYNPTVMSPGGHQFSIMYEGPSPDDAVLVVYELTSNGYQEVFKKFNNIDGYYYIKCGINSDDFRFISGKQYKLSLYTIYDRDYELYEIEDDMEKVDYYIVIDEAKSYVLVDGNNELTLSSYNSRFRFSLQASGLVHAVSDVEWLQVYDEDENINSSSYDIYATGINMTSEDRIGHVYFTCGNASAVVTINQKSLYPRIEFPAGISTSESSPTELPYGHIHYEAVCDTINWYIKQSGEYVFCDDLYCGVYAHKWSIDLDENYISAGATYKILVSTNNIEQSYYIKIGSSSFSSSVYLNGSTDPVIIESGASALSQTLTVKGANRWTASSNSSWLTISTTSGTTTQKNVTISATKNTTGIERTGIITFQGGSSTKKYPVTYISVTQKAADTAEYLTIIYDDINATDEVNVDDADLSSFTGSGMSFYLRCFAPGTATVSTDSEWITLKTTSVESGEEVRVTLAKNATGMQRSGHITFVCGNQSKTVTVRQLLLLDAPILLNGYSTSSSSPTVVDCSEGSIVLSWNAVSMAERYQVRVVIYGTNGNTTYYADINNDGSDVYNYYCPEKWICIGQGFKTRFTVYALGDGMTGASANCYILPEAGDGLYVDGSLAPVWDNATDSMSSMQFPILSNTNWTASTTNNWITLNSSSGSNGDTLDITLSQNTGNVRTGYVTVTAGSASSTLTINQCAALTPYPLLTVPDYSTTAEAPTLLPADTSEIYAAWVSEPQASNYQLVLSHYEEGSASEFKRIVKSPYLKPDVCEYTFSNLDLAVGDLYRLLFFRTNNGISTATAYYFMLDSGNSYVTVDGNTEVVDEEEPEGGGSSFTISSSGVWSAESDVNWITVGTDRKYSPKVLAELGDTIEQHMYCHGAGARLQIYVMPNEGSSSRTGSITLRSGSSTATITITQYRSYTLAELTSPALSRDYTNPTDLSYGPVALKWSVGEGGTGKYRVRIAEYDSDAYRSGTMIYLKEGLTGSSHTVPVDILTEGKYYCIRLGTELMEDDYSSNIYYFRLSSKNELTLTPTVSWAEAGIGGKVDIWASASGGGGTYKFAYELLRNNEQVSITNWMTDKFYNFPITEAGTYQVKVYVIDGFNVQKTVLSDTYTVSKQADTLSLSQTSLAFDANGGSENISVTASGNWSYTKSGTWVTVTKGTYTLSISVPAYTSTTDRSGSVTVTCGEKSLTINVYQLGKPAGSSTTLSISNSVWNITGTEAASMTMSITATDAWSISTLPDWITAIPTSGNGNGKVVLYATANTGEGRAIELTFSSGNVSRALRITQTGIETGAYVSSFDISNASPFTGEEVRFEIYTSNADEVELLVDGRSWDSRIAIVNNHATFIRSFSAGGERQVQFVPYRNGVMGTISEAKALNVQFIGSLSAPNIHQPVGVTVGNSVVLEWDPVSNAEEYSVVLYHGDSVRAVTGGQSDNSVTLPETMLWDEGYYIATVLATAKGYSQSEASVAFEVSQPSKSFSIVAPISGTYVLSDNIVLTANNPDRSNLVFRVEHDGSVYYYPENGTINEATISKAMDWGTVGNYSITLLAFPTSERWSDELAWASETRSITLNGPVLQEKYVGNTKIALSDNPDYIVLYTTDATSFTAVYNNAAIMAELTKDGGTPITMEGPNPVSGHDWWNSFTLSTNQPTEGKHEYIAKATDQDLNFARAIFRFYAVTRQTTATKYPQNSSVAMYRYPDSSSTRILTLYPSDSVKILGQCGNYWYSEVGTQTGFVSKTALGDTRLTSWDGLAVSFAPDTTGTTYYYTKKTPTITVKWTSSVELPESAMYRLSYIKESNGEKKVVYSGTNTYAEFASSTTGVGLLKAQLEVVSKDGAIVYYSVDEGGKTYVTDNFELYIQLSHPEDFEWYKESIAQQADMLINCHLLFTTGYYDNAGGKIGPIDYKSITDGVFAQRYDVLFGDGTSLESQWGKCAFIAEEIMAECTDYSGGDIYIAWSKFKEIMETVGVPKDIIEEIYKLKQISDSASNIFTTRNGTEIVCLSQYRMTGIENVMNRKMDSNTLNQTFKELKTVNKLVVGLLNMAQKYVIYSRVDKAKVRVYIDKLNATGNEDLMVVAKILDILNDDPTLIAYLAQSYGFDQVKSFLEKKLKEYVFKGLSKWSGFKLMPGWAMTISIQAGVTIGTGINELLLNVSSIQTGGYQLKWAVNTAEAYRPYFERRLKEFLDNPFDNYESFLAECETFESLISLEYSTFKQIPQALDESVWNKVWSWAKGLVSAPSINKNQQLIDSIDRLSSFIDGYVSRWVKDFNNNCLVTMK